MKTKSPKMKALLDAVMGTDTPMTEEEALANLKPPEDESTKDMLTAVFAAVSHSTSHYDVALVYPNVEVTPVYNMAYDITYDDDTKNYILHTIEYGDDGHVRYIGKETFARYLPECSHKLNAMMMDKLIYSAYPGRKPKKT